MDKALEEFQDFYIKGEFEKAISFLADHKKDFSSGVWHYNLGTLYAKTQMYSNARYHLELAKQSGLVNSQISKNMTHTVEKLGVLQIEQTSNFVEDLYIKSYLSTIGPYLTLSLCFVLISLGFIRYTKNLKKIPIIVIFSLVPVLYYYLVPARSSVAVVLNEKPVYEGPSKVFEQSHTVPSGVRIILGQARDSFYYIKFPTQLSGWIDSENLGIIKDRF